MRVLSVRARTTTPAEELLAAWLHVAPEIAVIPGCISKLWVRDDDVFGGIYVFQDQASLDAYAAGPLVAAVLNDPTFSEFRVEQYDVVENLSAITHGIAAAALRA